MLQMECTNLTPSSVLETSGHVDRFTDFMVRDEVSGECFRADKLLEDAIDEFLADKANSNLSREEKEAHRKCLPVLPSILTKEQASKVMLSLLLPKVEILL